MRQSLSHAADLPVRRRWPALMSLDSEINQLGGRCAQMLLEIHEPWVVQFGPAQVELLGLCRLTLLDCLPKEEGHAAQVMKPLVRAAVLVDQRVLERHRQNAGDRLTVLGNEANDQAIAKTVYQVPKPRQRLRRKLMPAAGEQEQMIELWPAVIPTVLLRTLNSLAPRDGSSSARSSCGSCEIWCPGWAEDPAYGRRIPHLPQKMAGFSWPVFHEASGRSSMYFHFSRS